MDALSGVLEQIRLRETRWACAAATAPWGLSFPEARGCLQFHYVLRGNCWLSVATTRRPQVALSGGDLAILPQGHGHTLRDHTRSAATDFNELSRRSVDLLPGVKHLQFGGGGGQTDLIYGAFLIDTRVETPILATLPALVRITPDEGQTVPSFRQNLQFIAQEILSNRLGAHLVLTRMADVILIQVLRAYIETLPERTAGLLGALRDTHVATALGLMHQRPEARWTVASLAGNVGLSRAGFAARFTSLVGEPPRTYLTRLRMQRASALLRDGATLGQASKTAGYASEASFSHAFRQQTGLAPGAFRRRARHAKLDEQ